MDQNHKHLFKQRRFVRRLNPHVDNFDTGSGLHDNTPLRPETYEAIGLNGSAWAVNRQADEVNEHFWWLQKSNRLRALLDRMKLGRRHGR